MRSFKDQVAVITGAASGLGFAIASKLSSEGVKLALLDFNGDKLEQIAGEMATETKIFVLDITDEAQVRQTIDDIKDHFGKLDILVNSAGITGQTNLKSHLTETEDVRKVFEVNYFGSYYTSKHALPYMVGQGYGRVLHIASIAGKEGNAGMIAYSSSKAAVIGMTKVQGKEYAETGITVNALAPAVIRTAMVEAMPEEQVKYMTDKIPAKRCGTLEEVANLVAYIVSPMNSFTTAFTFDLSGGRATY
ncbi:MAG TPA: SDR family NAD(P)-dependent oxidoreductase [Cyclobacteriaceae bacterium]|nr:SDR family NAD(P)-dependent oxidoreductase [Cyclobacteriaceae bacterium]